MRSTWAGQVGQRLVITRKALGLVQTDFAAAAGLSQARYSAYETGGRMLTLEAARGLCEAYNLSYDWLYRGDALGLPQRLALVIREQERG